jgi:5'-3' exonuclease
MSKIVEKKRRKYIKYLVNLLKTNIYEKFKDTIDDKRDLFQKNYINISNINNKWSICIQEIYNNLNSSIYKTNLKNKCINLKNIEISSSYEFGEGEKKITEHILNYKRSGSYVIFSPDGDVILLSLLIQTKLTKIDISNSINVIRHNQNLNEIENISICELRDNLYKIIYDKMNTYRKYNHNKNNIIDDVISLMTFFGNDFLPKIESINMKNGIKIILDLYARHLNWCRDLNIYLLFEDNNITKINYNVLINIINKLAEYEEKLIFDKYMANEYKNFNYLAEIFNPNNITPFFIDRLNRYCHGFNKIIRYIRLNLNSTSDDIIKNIIDKFTDKDNFINQFVKIEGLYNNDQDDKITYLKSLLDKMIQKINDNNGYKCGLKLVKYSDSIDDKFHQKCIKENLLHNDMNTSQYDIELYKLDKKMDQYKNIGFDIDNKIGIIELKYKNSEYKIYTDKDINIKKKNYYESIMQCQTDEMIKYVCKEYIKGFFWVIDYYFNKNNRTENINNISIWYYRYNHAPYFNELSSYLNSIHNKNNELNKIFQSISNINNDNFVRASEFMNSFEQYLYITPNIKNIPETYKEILTDNNIFIDINEISKQILNGDNTMFDSYNTKFLNKGNIIGLKNCDYKYFMEKIGNFRKFMSEIEIYDEC